MSELQNGVLKYIIDEKSIEVHFQPIVSILRKSMIGIEGLSRGVQEDRLLVQPIDLFEAASKSNERVALDRLCREKVIESFTSLNPKNKNLLLFLNIDATAIIEEVLGSGFIINLTTKFNIKPENIVLEIVESKVSDIEALKKFIQTQRKYGFLIALDNIGSGNSNLDKIAVAKPDIVKIDSVIVRDIHMDYYKQEVFKSLVGLSKNLGALVIAEGVENEEEAMKVIELGADMLQGYYFAEPQKIENSSLKNLKIPLRKIANQYSRYLSEKIDVQKKRYKEYTDVIKQVLEEMSQIEEKRFDFKLSEIVEAYDFFECLYILDPAGIQVSDTITPFASFTKHKGLIFHPAKKGEDHSLKKYYYFLKNMKLSKYVTEPYISLASGNLCMTMSCIFKNIEEKKYILCVDLNPNYLSI